MRRDWIALVEAGYDMSGNEAQWLRRVLDHAAPLLSVPGEPMVWTYHCTPTTLTLREFADGTSRVLMWLARTAHRLSSDDSFDLTYRGTHIVDTASNLIFPQLPDMQRMFLKLVHGWAQDLLVIECRSGVGLGMAIGAVLKKPLTPNPPMRKRWQQVAAHIGAGLRMRARLQAQAAVHAQLGVVPVGDDLLSAQQTEAIFDGAGKLHDARERARARDARELLRAAVLRIDRCRSQDGRNSADAAMEAWEGLVHGRWSLVDKFDSDGKRFVVAVKNDPQHPDPRGLTQRERQVAEFVGQGRGTGEIAYLLGVSNAAVSNCVALAQNKLGLASRAELMDFFAMSGVRRKMAQVCVAGEQLLLADSPLLDARALGGLTPAEQDVTAQLIAGSTLSHIARVRGTRRSTVATQVQAIYQKLQVGSRAQLAFRIQRRK